MVNVNNLDYDDAELSYDVADRIYDLLEGKIDSIDSNMDTAIKSMLCENPVWHIGRRKNPYECAYCGEKAERPQDVEHSELCLWLRVKKMFGDV